ncbi:AF4/FMR2 family member 1-like isoform X2 [Pezoporus occidentalis]|uniref:AF4/FMR2 family member 1-like isoform X2 n=1 Tax=Pezoporus occidentalis TaxID=407982 RepID=UPI002F910B97
MSLRYNFSCLDQQKYCNPLLSFAFQEMTQSWPPLLTDIPTPPTAEPSKFPLPTKPVGCVAQNQRQYDGPSDTLPRSQTTVSVLLQEDLQVSDSEDSDDNQVGFRCFIRWARRHPFKSSGLVALFRMP